MIENVLTESAADSCAVKITWDVPTNIDSNTIVYNVRAKNSEGDMVSVKKCTSTDAWLLTNDAVPACNIQMSELWMQDFGLGEGDDVVVDVQACLKDEPEACGTRSVLSGGVVSILAAPLKMDVPIWTNPSERSTKLIKLEWTASDCDHCEADRNTYVVLWDQGYGFSDPRDF
jgi:hypothetical protein